jgi:hypothetical protein
MNKQTAEKTVNTNRDALLKENNVWHDDLHDDLIL